MMIKDCVVFAADLAQGLKLSFALFLHSKSMLEDRIEIITIAALRALLMRCVSFTTTFT